VVGQLTSIAQGIQQVFPDFGPFDASLAVQIPIVKGDPKLMAGIKSGSEPSVEFHVEFIETNTGRSKLDQCYSEVQLGRSKYRSASRPTQVPGNSQQVTEEVFSVPAEQYSGQAVLWRACIRRVATPIGFNLPPLEKQQAVVPENGASPPELPRQVATYVVCIGEHQQACGGNAAWLNCGGDPTAWAKVRHPECQNPTVQQLSSVSGNKCGYATFLITCL
jgi:hypothetical protein